MKFVLENVRVVCPVQQLDKTCDLYIDNGQILSDTTAPDGFIEDKRIDANGLYCLPGLVDGYAYLKDAQGHLCQSHLANVARYGYTTLYCAPFGIEATDQMERAQKVLTTNTGVDVLPIGALTQGLAGQKMTDYSGLSAACPVFSQSLAPMRDLNATRLCYAYAASFGVKVVILAVEPSLSNGFIHEGKVSALTGIKGIPECAETIAIQQHLALVEDTGVHAHFSHVTTAKGLELIEDAQQKGLAVTADCTMHHLHLSEVDVESLDPNTYVLPPLRSTKDLQALRRGLQTGVISSIVSSHHPMPSLSKLAPFTETQPGCASLPIMLSLGLHLVNAGHCTLMQLAYALSAGPLSAYGNTPTAIAVGEKANFCLVCPDTYRDITQQSFEPFAANSPFLGWSLPGEIRMTFKQGQCVHSSYDLQSKDHASLA